jgi:CRISPR-associated protein (TIGR03986 family)
MGWPGRGSYLKVKESKIGSKDIPGFLRLDDPNYHPQLHKVSFNIDIGSGRRGSYVILEQIGPSGKYAHEGVLVCSGNMLETGQAGQESPRKNHALVLAPDRGRGVNRVPIPKQVVEDYLDGMTPFEREELGDWKKKDADYSDATHGGCLGEGNPVFYVTEDDQVVQFGHCPNFRVSARQPWDGKERASTPQDFIPDELIQPDAPDFADAMFGWVSQDDEKPEGQAAGRVYIEDAQFLGADSEIWYKDEPIALHVLAEPKPTTFQHYLVQSKWKGHDPDKKVNLAHYGTPKDKTQLRGHKFYWFKGEDPDIEATVSELAKESQLTRAKPLRKGVRFRFRIHFENLREAELGALWWALAIPVSGDREYRHHIGMGKPLGMGAVKITPSLHLTNRQQRYQELFSGGGWLKGQQSGVNPEEYAQTFETYLREAKAFEGESLEDSYRIQELLEMMHWESHPEEKWLDFIRYMEIERQVGRDKVNEYKERPVLATPTGLRGIYKEGKPPISSHPNLVSNAQRQSRKVGTVKKFGLGDNASYGFITPDDRGHDVFVHISDLGEGITTLEEGQQVTYLVEYSEKGPQAKDVKLE